MDQQGHREVLRLSGEGWSYKDIAGHMGISEAYVSKLLRLQDDWFLRPRNITQKLGRKSLPKELKRIHSACSCDTSTWKLLEEIAAMTFPEKRFHNAARGLDCLTQTFKEIEPDMDPEKLPTIFPDLLENKRLTRPLRCLPSTWELCDLIAKGFPRPGLQTRGRAADCLAQFFTRI